MLWSMKINGKRNCFAGCLFESAGTIFLGWDGFGNFPIDGTAYFARVIPLKLDAE